jgi:hypothetical protein
MITPPYLKTYRPELKDQQTWRFIPNASGGYDAALAAFSFETELGARLEVQPTDNTRNQRIAFAFPFYGHSYTEIYVTNSGAISLGAPFWQPNMQARSLTTPAIFPLPDCRKNGR